MKETVKELEQTIASLEDELRASMAREKQLEDEIKAPRRESWVRRKINDPGSKIGKIIRLPRTAYRIVRYPEVRRELRGEAPLASENNNKHDDYEENGTKNERMEFAPVKFFNSEDTTLRVNLVVRKIQKDILKKAIEFANLNDCELRVVTYGEKSGVNKYREFKKEKSFPIAKQISFYSSVKQAERKKPFELEIGKNEMFLTEEWGIDGRE